MNIAEVLAVIGKGVGVIKTLYKFKEDATPAIQIVTDLVTGAQQATLTDAQLTEHENSLDALIDRFNEPME